MARTTLDNFIFHFHASHLAGAAGVVHGDPVPQQRLGLRLQPRGVVEVLGLRDAHLELVGGGVDVLLLLLSRQNIYINFNEILGRLILSKCSKMKYK